ncbi:MAG: hypothetical protein AAGG68_00200 [Bacteroidota bacterium]
MKTIITFFLLFSVLCLFAQNNQSSLAGARGAAMGSTGILFTDINSAFVNQAGLANLEGFAGNVFAERRFLNSPINSISGAAAAPVSFGTFAITINSFGIENYQEQKIGLAYARQLLKGLSIGVQFDYLSTNIPLYGNVGVFTFEAGLQAQLLQDLQFGFHLYSPAQIDLVEEVPLPTIYKAGLAYTPSDKVFLIVEVEKDIDYPVRFKAGAEYQFSETFFLRTGIATQPTLASLGIGVLFNERLAVDISASYHQILGVSPSVGVSYQLPQKNN